jgi:hypothetical protein
VCGARARDERPCDGSREDACSQVLEENALGGTQRGWGTALKEPSAFLLQKGKQEIGQVSEPALPNVLAVQLRPRAERSALCAGRVPPPQSTTESVPAL